MGFVTMTTEILFVTSGQWMFGDVGCKLFVYGQVLTLTSTIFLLTAMSVDRYQVRTATDTFLPRDAMRNAVGPRLSVTFVYCIQTAKDIAKLISQHGNSIILVFDHKRRRCQIPRGR